MAIAAGGLAFDAKPQAAARLTMRYIQIGLGLALLVGVAGCPEGSRLNLLRPNSPVNPLPATPPSREELVSYLNDNSANLPGVVSDDVTLTVYIGGGVGVPIGGW